MRTMPTSRKSTVGRQKRCPPRSCFTSDFRLPTSDFRRGTTLAEVLVSTLVMSIGIVSLATLFPISVLRSIQASQLTNAAVLRYNAESLLRTVPEALNLGREWQPRTAYSAGDRVVPVGNIGNTGRPRMLFVRTTTGAPAATTGGSQPDWNSYVENDLVDDGVTTGMWRTVTLPNYVVDPMGYVLVDPLDPSPGGFRTAFGAITGAQEHFGNVNGTPFKALLNRFPAFGIYQPTATALQNEFTAAELFVLPDSWTLQAESLELNYTSGNTDITLGGVDYAELSTSVQFATPDPVPDRIVMFDDTNRRSATYPVTNLVQNGTATDVTWSGIALPFTPVKARVESLERRYSYLLSVGGGGRVDVVVFFRRSYGIEDEQVYSCAFRRIDRGVNLVAGDADDPAPPQRDFCILQHDSSTGIKPFYKKGSFICDINNLQWYRVIDVTEGTTIGSVTPTGYEADTGAPGMDRFVRLTLDQPIAHDSLATTTVGGVDVVGGAVLMRGVVEVFPLRAPPVEE